MIFIIMVGNMVGNSNSIRTLFKEMQTYLTVIIDKIMVAGEGFEPSTFGL